MQMVPGSNNTSPYKSSMKAPFKRTSQKGTSSKIVKVAKKAIQKVTESKKVAKVVKLG